MNHTARPLVNRQRFALLGLSFSSWSSDHDPTVCPKRKSAGMVPCWRARKRKRAIECPSPSHFGTCSCGARRLADCSGQMMWPKRGAYLVQPGAMSLAISTIPTTSTSNLGRDGRNRELARATAIAKGACACDFDGCQKLPLPSEVTRRSFDRLLAS
jgi:hypothetical protein